MRILFIGDVVGRSGRDAVQKHLPILKQKLSLDVVVLNGENAAHGFGITEKMCVEFFEMGVDCITTGNHVWDKREVLPYIEREKRLLRPLNFPPGTPGRGVWEHKLEDGRAIVVLNAMGQVFMDPLDNPFTTVRDVLKPYGLGRSVQAIFLDFHAEATSEKMAMGHYLDGLVSAVVGTHTHVPTADAHILSGGTAFQSDAGMTGDYDSVVGMRKDIPVNRFVRKVPGERKMPADGEGTLCGTFVTTSDRTGLAESIRSIRVGGILDDFKET